MTDTVQEERLLSERRRFRRRSRRRSAAPRRRPRRVGSGAVPRGVLRPPSTSPPPTARSGVPIARSVAAADRPQRRHVPALRGDQRPGEVLLVFRSRRDHQPRRAVRPGDTGELRAGRRQRLSQPAPRRGHALPRYAQHFGVGIQIARDGARPQRQSAAGVSRRFPHRRRYHPPLGRKSPMTRVPGGWHVPEPQRRAWQASAAVQPRPSSLRDGHPPRSFSGPYVGGARWISSLSCWMGRSR